MNRLNAWLALLLLAASTAVHAQSLVTIAETGARTARLNLVMLSEGYTSTELAANKFKNDATTISNKLLNIEPFKSYRPFFNVYGIEVASIQSGADMGTYGSNRLTYFGASYNSYGIDRLLTVSSAGYNAVFSLLNTHVPEHDIVLVIVNDPKYGGSGGSIAVTSTNIYAPDIAIHEIGHSFGGLGDEYDDPGTSPSEDPNTTQQTSRALIKWNHWINASTPIPTPETSTHGNGKVGLFEGAAYNPTGWYRPTLDSLMKSLGAPFYAVNEEALVLEMYSRVSPITSSSPTSSVTVNQPAQALTFTVDGPAKASTSTPIEVEWKLDGTVITGQTGRTLNYSSSTIGNGTHTLVATAKDTTTKVRKDTAGLLNDSRTWTLNLSNQGPAAPVALAAVLRPDGGVNLTWTDATADEVGFAIERALGNSMTYTEIGRVGVNTTAYTDSTTTPGTSTKYRVKGVNAANTAVLGLSSNVVTVIPQIAPSPVSASGNVTVPRGQPASFTVQATGTLLRYQWRRNMSNITNATKATYALTAAQVVNAGMYDCVVSNDVGSYTSAAALLTVNAPAEITAHPASSTVFYDQPVTLSVQATGTATIMHQWRKNGVNILGATASSLSLSHPGTADAAAYDCRVTNAFGTALSKAAVLTVLGPPLITTPPANTVITRGQTASFTIAAKGTATLAYQWRRNGIPITGATTTKLTIANAKDSDATNYDCIVSNGHGRTTSAPATLSFLGATTTDYRLAGDRAGTAKWKWVKRFGGAARDTATALSVAPGGSVYIGGLSQSSGIKLDALPASNLGAYIGWLQADGKALAIESLNTGATDHGTVSIGPSSMQYIAAAQTSTANPGLVAYFQFGGIPSGSFTTTFAYGDFNYDTVVPEAAVAGAASMFIGGYVPVTPPTTHYPVVRKVDLRLAPAGAPASWTRTITSQGSADSVLAVLRLASGKVVVAGTAQFDSGGQISFENGSHPGGWGGGGTYLPPVVLNGVAGSQTGFITCYDDNGEVQWTRAYARELRSLAVDGNGAVWAAGTEAGTVAVLLKINAANGDNDARFPVTGADGLAAAVCTGGDVALLTRTSASSMTAQGYTQARSGYTVLKFSSTGTLRWVLPVFGSYGDAFGSLRARLASGSDGALYAALSLEGDGNAEFAGIAPFAMKGRQSDAFIAAISEGPQIITPLANQIVSLGQPLQLSVTTEGLAGTISHQWFKDGKVLAGKNASTLSIAITKLTDAGSYSCKVTGNGGTTESAKAIVNIVDTAPRTLKSPNTKPLDLPVSAAGSGLSYTWWKNGVRIFNQGGFSNTSTSKLRINAMSAAFIDNYVCKVSGPAGTLDVPFMADMMLAPVFTPPVVPASIVSGTFLLQLSATDAASYKVSTLPAGLVYDPKTGRITGKPTTPGSKLITVTATNAAGTSSPALTFTITVDDIAAYAKGTLQAMIARQPWNANLGGFLSFTLSASGVPTGTLKYAGASHAISGRVDAVPATHQWTFFQRIARSGKPALLVNLTSPTAHDGELTGTIALEAAAPETATVSGRQNVWSVARLPTAFAGTYNATMSLPPLLVGDLSVPQGPNTLKTVIHASTGLASWSGKLGDNTAFSGSTYLWPSGAVPTWVSLYSNLGSLLGTPVIASPNQTGTLEWTRNAKIGSPSWSSFPLTVTGVKSL